MKKMFLAALFCVMGTIAANAQWFVNYTNCPVNVQQICVNTNPCAKILGPMVTLAPGAIIPIPFVPCNPGQETMYQVCWTNCPGICTIVSATPPPQICLAGVPFSAPLAPGCLPCGPATVTVDPFTGTLKVY